MIETIRIDRELANFDAARVPIKSSERVSGNIPYLGASGEVDRVEGFTHDGDYLCVSEDGENLRSRNTPIAWVQRGKFWANNHVHILGGLPLARLKFYEAALAVAPITSYITGSAQPKLSQTALSSVLVPRFDPADQVAVGQVLGALDDKIAANLSAAEISDSLVRSMYRTLQLSEKTLGDVALNVRESVNLREISADEPYIGLEHVDRRHLWLERQGAGADVVSSKSRFGAGDVLFGKLRPYFHKVALASSQGVCSTDILVLRARDEENVALVAASASSDAVVAAAVQASNGTKMPRAKWTDIAGCRVPDPDSSETRTFCRTVEAIAKRAMQANEENRQLTATRDELLPLLMSGKITIKDAEKTVEEVV